MVRVFTERFDRALVFAHQLHRTHQRKTSGAPYVAHLLGVAALVTEYGGTEDEAIAALLHDSIEDRSRHFTGGRNALAAEIARQFGPEVLTLVEHLTERPAPAERGLSDKRERWIAHKQAYFEQIRTAPPSVRLISSADSIYNVRSMTRDYLRMGDEVWNRFLTRSRDDQLWAYTTLAETLLTTGAGPIGEELRRAVDELRKITTAG